MEEKRITKAKAVLAAFAEAGKSFGTAESCTGGFIAKTVTDLPGASAAFFGGVVSYDNSVKEKVLGVSHETLTRYGAVSEQTAREMADGAVRVLSTDAAVSVTGIAGPDGGTPEKPVGLVYIAAAQKSKQTLVRKCLFAGDRESVRTSTVEEALTLLLERFTKD